MKRLFLAAVIAALPSLAPADQLSEADIKKLALEAILENPEIVMEAVAILQQRDAETQEQERGQVLNQSRQDLENDPNAPVLGNPEGDAVVVEFFDYNCPYCKQAAPDVKALIAADPDVKVVYREWPILGEGSVFAARAALASRAQDLYDEFHWALMDIKGRAEEGSVLRAAEEVGLDIERLRADMEDPDVAEHIATSMRLAQSLGFNGTPSFVIGDALVPGVVPLSDLEKFVARARTPE